MSLGRRDPIKYRCLNNDASLACRYLIDVGSLPSDKAAKDLSHLNLVDILPDMLTINWMLNVLIGPVKRLKAKNMQEDESRPKNDDQMTNDDREPER